MLFDVEGKVPIFLQGALGCCRHRKLRCTIAVLLKIKDIRVLTFDRDKRLKL
jgi:hypothetical protein